MTNKQNLPGGFVSSDEIRWLRMRAEGGFGMIMTSASHVNPKGQCFPGELGFADDSQIAGLASLADVIRNAGSVSCAQLYHSGPRAMHDPIAPSADDNFNARELSIDEIKMVRDDFVLAALRAQKAGFDGVEIHGAHGFLLCQFLSAGANRRTDEYGGSIENRVRLISEIISGIRESCGPGFQLGLRISAERYGLKLSDMLTISKKFLSDEQIDYLDVSLWDVGKEPDEEAFRGRPIMSYFTELKRGRVKLGLAGKIRSAESAIRCLQSGADYVLMGRAALLLHNLPLLIRGRSDVQLPTPPISARYLASQGLGAPFIEYILNWKQFQE